MSAVLGKNVAAIASDIGRWFFCVKRTEPLTINFHRHRSLKESQGYNHSALLPNFHQDALEASERALFEAYFLAHTKICRWFNP